MSSYRVVILERTSEGTTNTNQVFDDMEAIEGWKCLECEEVAEDPGESPLYECGECGTQFNRDNSADGGSHKCPECNKFAAKIADHCCDDCGQGEQEPFTYVECPKCDEKVDEGDFVGHLESCLA